MELPRGTSVYYSEREDFIVNDEFFDSIEPDFKGYIRIFGKNKSVEDAYILIGDNKIVAADIINLGTNQTFKGDEALTLLKNKKYGTATVEFVTFDDFMFDVALELNRDCVFTGKKVSKKKLLKKEVAPPKKLDREALLKKYRIKVPTDETILKFFGEKNEKIIALEEECKPEILKIAKREFSEDPMTVEVGLQNFEAFLRGKSLYCSTKLNVLHLKGEIDEMFRGKIEKIIKETIKKKMKKLKLKYKVSVNVILDLKLHKP
jgi:hypothetical protein